ncbi:hypothetical protein T07_13552 [Trichinella nelsoni]|uniref:Uncharacterized protein n=1 Tax=Trichinella nelsoni TaxID=6336 RepID=A0A0V0S6W1_9BILA|nr:hypothetical protein T07_13552 [Trichinella nelsoni]
MLRLLTAKLASYFFTDRSLYSVCLSNVRGQVFSQQCRNVEKNKSRNAFLTPSRGYCAQLTGPSDPDDGCVLSRRQPCNIILLFDGGSSTCCACPSY